MTDNSHEATLLRLRNDFDAQFRAPFSRLGQRGEAYLCISFGADSYALAARELAALSLEQPLTKLPSTAPHLLGICMLRGHLTPVFDLAAVLGYTHAGANPRWLAMLRCQEPLAIAFSNFEGYLEIQREPEQAQVEQDASGALVRHVVSLNGTSRFVINVAALIATLSRGALPPVEQNL